MNYDVIGDIHGHADKLTALLRKMGYRHHLGAWRHPERTVDLCRGLYRPRAGAVGNHPHRRGKCSMPAPRWR